MSEEHQHAPHGHEPGRIHTEEAVLDIGGDIGALILYTDAHDQGREIEVSAIGSDNERVHTAIHQRLVSGQVVFAGIFPQLREGAYRIWVDRPELADRVTIVGGRVSEVDWRTGRS